MAQAKYHFISGLPRSGSTLLAALLLQNPRCIAGMKSAFYSEHAASTLLIDYDLLAQAPQKVLPLIYDFIGAEPFEHDFQNIQYDAPEFDAPMGMRGLYKVRPEVSFEARDTILPSDLFQQYSPLSFWKDTAASRANVTTTKLIPTATGN